MQIHNQNQPILSPFRDPMISFSMEGSSILDPTAVLLPEELSLITGKESIKWQEEYSRGRLAGRKAILSLGGAMLPILKGEGGEPLFPAGFIGSISHSGGMGVACVSKSENYLGLGVDLENYQKKRQVGIFKKIATEVELSWILEDEQDSQRRGVLIFSIKESIYKAVYQAFKVRLRYMDAEVLPDLEVGEASIRIFKEGFKEVVFFSGFSFFKGFVVSGVSVNCIQTGLKV